MLVIISIPATALLFLQNKKIQTRLTAIVTRELSDNLGTNIQINEVSITFINRIQLKDVYLEDLNGDTLLFSKKIKATINKFNRSNKEIGINRLNLSEASVHLLATDTSGINLSFIINKLKNPDKTDGPRWKIGFDNIQLDESRFRFSDPYMEKKGSPIDYSAMDLKDLNIKIANLSIDSGYVSFDIRNLAFIERSGFRVKSLSSMLMIGRNLMHFDDVSIETQMSSIAANSIHFNFDSFGDFSDFVHKVNLKFDFRSSSLYFNDLSFFSRGLESFNETIRLSGLVTGTINEMASKNLLLSYNDHTILGGSVDMYGLPDFRETFMHLNINMFQTNVEDLRNIRLPGNKNILIPENLDELGTITYTGKFTGYYDDFVTYGKFGSNLGNISTDLLLKRDSLGGLKYMGRVKTRSFELGKIVRENQNLLGNISISANVDGYLFDERISADLNGNIDSLHVYGYNYKNIDLSGFLSDKIFDGSVNISDPNIQMEFLGKVDFSSQQPVFNFTADVSRLRPYYLNLNKTDPSYFASFLLKSNFSGIHPDSINGNINLVNSFFQRSGEQIQIYDLSLKAENSGTYSSLQVRSDALDADVQGYYQFSNITRSFKSLAARYIPSLTEDSDQESFSFKDRNDFSFSIALKKVEKIVRFFTRDYMLSDSTFISGRYNPSEFSATLTAMIPRIGYRENYWSDLHILAESDSIKTEYHAFSSKLHLKNEMKLDNMALSGSVFQDSLVTSLTWDSNQQPEYKGEFNISAGFADNIKTRNQKIVLHTLPSYIVFNDTLWNISPSVIRIDSSNIKVDSFNISNQNQEFLVAGEVSESSGSSLNMYFNDLDLATLNVLTRRIKLDLAGSITGQASLINAYESPLFLSDLRMNELFINGQDFGEGELRAKWDNLSRKIHMLASGVKGEAEIFRVEGDYFPSNKDLQFSIDFDKIRLSAFEPFAELLISDMKGLGSGNLILSGTASQPELNGEISLFKASLIVNYLQTRYSFTDKVKIYNNDLSFDNFKLTDELGNNAIANGNISSQYFRNFNINLNISTPDFLFLNTTEKDNEIFYGTVIASGIVKINGPVDNLFMDINASSGKNTIFYIPLYGAEEVNENDFIRFVSTNGRTSYQEEPGSNYEVNLKGLSLNFNLEVTPDAEVQLIFDPKVGDILSGRGNGNLNITINSLGRFEIFGDMVIEEGDYLFTLQNLINKKLEVQPGGRITFNGNPTDANLDLRAIYKLRTSVYTLAPEPLYENGDLKKRIPVECHIIMSGKLLEPTIQTDIVLPTADQQIKNIVSAAINSEEERLKQFISLLVINNFMSIDPGESFLSSTGGSSTASMAGVATSELLSNQLSHWLSQISQDFDIGLNYRPGDEITTDELEVALSTQILDDRITIQGNLGVGGQTTQTSSSANTNNIVGDFDIDFKITENGKLHLKAFNRANDDLLYQTSPYTQGVGVFYREDFNTFGELMKRYKDAIIRFFSFESSRQKPENDETSMKSR